MSWQRQGARIETNIFCQFLITLAIRKSLALRSRYSASEQDDALGLGVRVPVYFLVRCVECSKWHEADRQKYCLEGFDEDFPWLPRPGRLTQISQEFLATVSCSELGYESNVSSFAPVVPDSPGIVLTDGQKKFRVFFVYWATSGDCCLLQKITDISQLYGFNLNDTQDKSIV